jgi:Arc/MetJ-type ribon-helix-helix transcriptional regulator
VAYEHAGRSREGNIVSDQYITSEDHLPADTDGEITLQVTDQRTKHIFTTRARIARDAAELDDPDPLTILRGPHENREDRWYIEVIEADISEPTVDEAALETCFERSREGSNVLTARGEDVKTLVAYLVETGEYESVSNAVRSLLRDHLSETRPELVDRYVDLRTEREREEAELRLGGGHGE